MDTYRVIYTTPEGVRVPGSATDLVAAMTRFHDLLADRGFGINLPGERLAVMSDLEWQKVKNR